MKGDGSWLNRFDESEGEGGWEGHDSWNGTWRDGREVGEELLQGGDAGCGCGSGSGAGSRIGCRTGAQGVT